jgi:hypothetical protein
VSDSAHAARTASGQLCSTADRSMGRDDVVFDEGVEAGDIGRVGLDRFKPTVPTVETCAMDFGDAWSHSWSELV